MIDYIATALLAGGAAWFLTKQVRRQRAEDEEE